jgi:hypothetical protein
VRAALVNSGYEFPPRRITVNLAPAYLRKVDPAFDLPLAVALLVSSGQSRARTTPPDREGGRPRDATWPDLDAYRPSGHWSIDAIPKTIPGMNYFANANA